MTKKPTGRPVPPQLVGKGFDAFPSHINRAGRVPDQMTLKKVLDNIGDEEIEIEIGKGRNKTKVKTSRLELMLLGMYGSKLWQDREMILQYRFGKVPDKLELDVPKTISVTIKKEDDAG